MKYLLGATLILAVAIHPVAALAATPSGPELHSQQVSGVVLKTTPTTIWSFKAGVSGTVMVVATGKDATKGGSATTYVLRVGGVSIQGWAFGDLYLTRTTSVKAGDIVKVYGFYKGGTGATLTGANMSAIISQR